MAFRPMVRVASINAAILAALVTPSCKKDELQARGDRAELSTTSAPVTTTPGPFAFSVDRDGPADETFEVRWTEAEGASRYRLTVTRGEACADPISGDGATEVYEVTTTSVELPPLAPGSYAICATALNLPGNGRDAENSGMLVTVDGRQAL